MRYVLAVAVAFATTSPVAAVEQITGSTLKRPSATTDPMVSVNLEV